MRDAGAFCRRSGRFFREASFASAYPRLMRCVPQRILIFLPFESTISRVESSIRRVKSSIPRVKSSVRRVISSMPRVKSSIRRVESSISRVTSSVRRVISIVRRVISSIPRVISTISNARWMRAAQVRRIQAAVFIGVPMRRGSRRPAAGHAPGWRSGRGSCGSWNRPLP